MVIRKTKTQELKSINRAQVAVGSASCLAALFAALIAYQIGRLTERHAMDRTTIDKSLDELETIFAVKK